MDEAYEDRDYESGPFCRHWSDPHDCEKKCARCGHSCKDHFVPDPAECNVTDCECFAYVDEEED